MSTVDEWARREAVGSTQPDMTDAERAFWIAGQVVNANRMAALLLSDEAVEAASAVLADSHDVGTTDCTRRALQAALTKITTNETEEKK